MRYSNLLDTIGNTPLVELKHFGKSRCNLVADRASALSASRMSPSSMAALIQRKSSPRLPNFPYKGSYAYLVTINTSQGIPYFADVESARSYVDELLRHAQTHSFHVHAYCFMPDHVHLLVQGQSDDAHLGRLIQNFKQVTSFRFKRSTGRQLWQRSYHDHIVRREEDLQQFAEYIWNNPIRAGLAETCEAYELSGPFGQT